MKIINFLISIFLIYLLGCKKDNQTVANENQTKVKLLWRNKEFDWIPTTLVVNDKTLYFGNSNRNFYSVNLENPVVNLKFETDYNPCYKALIDNQRIYLTEYGTDLNCIDLAEN